MTQIKSAFTRANYLAAAGALVFAAVLAAVPFQTVGAGPLRDRSLMVTSTQPGDDTNNGAGEDVSDIPGHPNNGEKVGHTYTFTPYTAGGVESLRLVYCNTPFGYLEDDCDGSNPPEGMPTGMDISNAATATVTVYNSSDVQQDQDTFTAADTGNILDLEADDTGVTVAADDYVVVEFEAGASNYFTNPSSSYVGTGNNQNPNGTYFVNITTYSDTLTTAVDNGTVTNSIADSITITTRVQETLNFSVEGDATGATGATAPTWDGGTCDPLTQSTAITMGDNNNALAHDTAYDAYSYFRLATNSASGARVFYSGHTLESGTLEINPVGDEAVVSTPGTEQFGLAFDTTTSPESSHSFNHLSPEEEYENGGGAINGSPVAEFAFETDTLPTPALIASSAGIVQCDTGAIRYIANISPDTEAGIYTTKINYIASPSY